MAVQQRLWESDEAEQAGVQQDDPICPVGGNVPQLLLLNEWMRTGNQNKHHSIPSNLTEMTGSTHSTRRALEQDGDTHNALKGWRGFWGPH